MHSSWYENSFLLLSLFAIRVLILRRNGDVLAPIASKCSAQGTSIDEVLWKSISFYFRQVINQIGIGVWEAVCKVNLVIIIVESVGEGQSVVAAVPSSVFSLKGVLIVINILTYSMPA